MVIVTLTTYECNTPAEKKLNCIIKQDIVKTFSLRDARQDERAHLTNISSNL